MKKILIWYLYELENSGGPKGYLYNIHKYLTSFPNPQITFLVDLITPIKAKKFQRSLKQTFFSRILNDIKQILNFTWRHYNYKCSNLDSINIEDFDIVHIHDVAEYFRFKNKYPTFSGKVVLTNHSPCPWAYEMMSHCIGRYRHAHHGCRYRDPGYAFCQGADGCRRPVGDGRSGGRVVLLKRNIQY